MSTKYVLLNQAFVGVGSCLAFGYLPYILVFISILPSVKRGKKNPVTFIPYIFSLLGPREHCAGLCFGTQAELDGGFFFAFFSLFSPSTLSR